MKFHQVLTNKWTIRGYSLLIGYIIWFNLSAHTLVNQTIKMPISVFNCDETTALPLQENITVVIEGPRSAIRSMSNDDYGIFINAQEFKNDSQLLLKRSHLFLPTSINVVSFSPRKIQIF